MDLDGEDGGCDFLSAEEQARAARFHFPEDARRWAVGRHLLRRTLGEVLSADPRALRFETGPLGKPRLAGSPLRFSVSHSDRRLLLALAWEREVGIDIERLRTDFVPEDLAAGVCSPDERDALGRVSPAARPAAFLALWTAKEAYGKALGVGLGFPLAALTLTLGADGRYDLRRGRRAADCGLPPGRRAGLCRVRRRLRPVYTD